MRIKLKVWTGPCGVKRVAELVSDAHIEVVVNGTEHIYCAVEAESAEQAKDIFRDKLWATFNKDFGLRPVAL